MTIVKKQLVEVIMIMSVRMNMMVMTRGRKFFLSGIFCDLAEAFECVNHRILLTKLHFFGIQGATQVGSDPT
jgi:hypothetical protein